MRKPNEATQGQIKPQEHVAHHLPDDQVIDNSPNTDQSPVIHSAIKTAAISSYCDKLTWDKTFIKEVKYNPAIQAWMDYSPEFYNWVRSCIMLHSDNSLDETVCTIPDQWRDDIGEKITIVTANYIPTRQGEKHQYKAGVYHVMN